MAAPNKAWVPDKVRKRIQVTKLVQRLEKHAFGEVEMSQSQVQAAKYLIDQGLGRAPQPITGEDGGPIKIKGCIEFVSASSAS